MATNYENAFASHPEVYAAWNQLNRAVKAGMDPRRYELATVAAALAIRSSYCSLGHGRILAEDFGEDVVAIVTDPVAAGLSDADIAVLQLAEKVALDATAVTDEDRQRVADLDVPPAEVELVVMAAAARCFFSKTLDGLGTLPDAHYRDLPADMQDALTVGRPIAER